MLRELLDAPAGLPARLLLGVILAQKQSKLLARWSEALHFLPLDVRELSKKISSKKYLFILASGESVEALSAKDFEMMSRHTTIGVNAWPLHPFIPDYYAFEPFDPESRDYVQLFTSVLSQQRFKVKTPGLLLFRPNSDLDRGRYSLIPEHFRPRASLYSRFVPVTRKRKTLGREIRGLHEAQELGLLGKSNVMDLGASVIRMISLGYILGFQNVVLVGADLNGGRYFWEANGDHLSRNGLTSFSPGFSRPIHETMTRANKAFVMSEVVEEFAEIFHDEGRKIYAGSPSSLLSAFLPVFPWSLV